MPFDLFSLDVEEAEAAVLATGPRPLGSAVRVLMAEASRWNASKNAIVDELATADGALRKSERLVTLNSRVYVQPGLYEIFANMTWLKARRMHLKPTAEQLYDMVNGLAIMGADANAS